MFYVKITNKGTTHRNFLEIIGAGTKQDQADNQSIVGQFHSGFKMAVVAAMRLGLRIAIASHDEVGPYILEFESKEIKFQHDGKEFTTHLVCYKYSDNTRLETKMALTAFPKWTQMIGSDGSAAYPILRELIANARDADKNFSIERNTKQILFAPKGCTAVYIEERDDVGRILGIDAPRYFKFLSDESPVAEVAEMGAIYPKSENGKIRYFNQGHLVGCEDESGSNCAVFDYDAYGKDLVSEERIIPNIWRYYQYAAKFFSKIYNEAVWEKMIASALASGESVEGRIIYYISTSRSSLPDELKKIVVSLWRKHEKLGEKMVMSAEKVEDDAEACSRGFGVVHVNYRLKTFFAACGIPDSTKKLAELMENIELRSCNEAEMKRAAGILEENFFPLRHYAELWRKKKIRIGAFDHEGGSVRGLAKGSEFYLESRVFSDPDPKIIRTIDHELAHIETETTDDDYRVMMNCLGNIHAKTLIIIAALRKKLIEMGVNPADVIDELVK